ncbi:hypothetical protein NDU88_004706 [Pleurodeles waltl]|uniref:Uncharacterized protein n=1 Tax=Pleurodeles waltl TaxID=8319 RepID=A0AAV7VH07_PLEWA|nr:hypothetical protein NDU88_004706 [Pleurodeles waltl]
MILAIDDDEVIASVLVDNEDVVVVALVIGVVDATIVTGTEGDSCIDDFLDEDVSVDWMIFADGFTD